jgi:hypothetical protein
VNMTNLIKKKSYVFVIGFLNQCFLKRESKRYALYRAILRKCEKNEVAMKRDIFALSITIILFTWTLFVFPCIFYDMNFSYLGKALYTYACINLYPELSFLLCSTYISVYI